MDTGLLKACARLPLNDVGNGARFKTYFGSRAIWAPRVGWAVLLRGVWTLDLCEIEVRRMAHLVATLMVEEANHIAPGADLAGRRDDHLRFAVASGESARIDGMLREASVNLVGCLDVVRSRQSELRRILPKGVRHGHV